MTAVLFLLLAAACGEGPARGLADEEPSGTPMGTLRGTVTYRERIALSNRAVLELTLEDVSRQDVAAPVIAAKSIPDPGQVPIRFELDYPSDAIDPRLAYALRARITDGGRLLFTTDTIVPVLTRGAGREVHPVLTRVSGTGAAGLSLRGMFRYLADAALFRDCRTNRQYPVSMEGAFIEVERAYRDSGIEPGKALPMALTGRYMERPAMEGNRNEVKLIVDSFHKVLSDETCTPTAAAELVGTPWILTELDGRPVAVRESAGVARLLLNVSDQRAQGHGGCNAFFAEYHTDETAALSFSGIGASMMACVVGMDTEQAFLRVLGATTRYEISGEVLSLYAGDRLLARFEAVYL